MDFVTRWRSRSKTFTRLPRYAECMPQLPRDDRARNDADNAGRRSAAMCALSQRCWSRRWRAWRQPAAARELNRPRRKFEPNRRTNKEELLLTYFRRETNRAGHSGNPQRYRNKNGGSDESFVQIEDPIGEDQGVHCIFPNQRLLTFFAVVCEWHVCRTRGPQLGFSSRNSFQLSNISRFAPTIEGIGMQAAKLLRDLTHAKFPGFGGALLAFASRGTAKYSVGTEGLRDDPIECGGGIHWGARRTHVHAALSY